MKSRNEVIDIIRAFGIILVVIGHSTYNLFVSRFTYLFHLPLFFVLSGYLYQESSSLKPWEYIGLRMKSYLKVYVVYNTIFVIFHNVFLQLHLFTGVTLGFNDIIIGLLNSLFFTTIEPFSGALWFMPVLLVSLIFFNFIYYVTNSMQEYRELKRGLIILIITIVGIYLNQNNLSFGLHYQTVLVVLPYLYIGQLVRKNGLEKLKGSKICALGIVIITLIALYLIPGRVELSQNLLWKFYLFYPLATGMIYVTYVIAMMIHQHTKKMAELFKYIGRKTIPIMGLHFFCFKLFDFFVIHLVTRNYDILPRLTVSYPEFWPVYTIIGVIGSLTIILLIEGIKKMHKEHKWRNILEKILIST